MFGGGFGRSWCGAIGGEDWYAGGGEARGGEEVAVVLEGGGVSRDKAMKAEVCWSEKA